jgi:hypothetical protein
LNCYTLYLPLYQLSQPRWLLLGLSWSNVVNG